MLQTVSMQLLESVSVRLVLSDVLSITCRSANLTIGLRQVIVFCIINIHEADKFYHTYDIFIDLGFRYDL